MLAVSLGLMAATAEWLVQTMKAIHKTSNIEEEYASLHRRIYDILTDSLYQLDGLASYCFRLSLLRRMEHSQLSTSFDICYATFSKRQSRQRHSHVVRPSISAFNSFFSGCPSLSFSRGGLANRLHSFLVCRYYESIVLVGELICIPDLFQVAILVGACFLVNYVTADSKTNWAEGVAMVTFYIMIVSVDSPRVPLLYYMVTTFCRLFVHGSTVVNQK